jgi:thiamine biosynthesis lipoprotein
MSAVGSHPTLATATWEALGTTALVRIDEPAALDRACEVVSAELDAIDRAASRFRDDSELELVNRSAGSRVRIGPLLHEAIAVALEAAELTGGAVDPTLGEAIRLAGYTRDWREHARHAELQAPPRREVSARRLAGYKQVELVDDPRSVAIPAGIKLDLGATAKALAADRAAVAAAAETGAGVLVSLGGDIATAGPAPADGWQIHITDDHRSSPSAVGQTVSISVGALATSSTTTRRWRCSGEQMHHILDPATSMPTTGPWRTVSVAAATCVDANTASTAAIVLGAVAPVWLHGHGLAARLVATDGDVVRVGEWPA